jgi:hypothetical protein
MPGETNMKGRFGDKVQDSAGSAAQLKHGNLPRDFVFPIRQRGFVDRLERTTRDSRLL